MWPHEGSFSLSHMGYGHLFCLFHVHGDDLLLHCHIMSKLELITAEAFQPCQTCWFWGLFAWFISKSLCSLLLFPWCQDWNCKSRLPWGKAVSVLFLLTIPPLSQQDGSHQFWVFWVCLLSVTSSLSPHLCLGLSLLAWAYGFRQEDKPCARGEGACRSAVPLVFC